MRSDMSKKLVDCYRVGYTGKNPRVLAMRRQRLMLFEYEDETGETCLDLHDTVRAPKKTGIKPLGYDRKGFGENLNPLWRFLDSSVSRDWDEVYSEICEFCDKSSAVGAHIFQHLFDFVIRRNLVYMIDKVPHRIQPYRFVNSHLEPVTYKGSIGEWNCFYVHPETGTLCRGVKPSPKPHISWKIKNRADAATMAARVYDMGGGIFLSKHPDTDLWYRIEYRAQSFAICHEWSFITGGYIKVRKAVHKAFSLPTGLLEPGAYRDDEDYYVFKCGSASKREIEQVSR